ncbi:methyltransferase domain-containing protein, partial [bacterium]
GYKGGLALYSEDRIKIIGVDLFKKQKVGYLKFFNNIIQLVRADASWLPFPESSIDIVVSLDMLEHMAKGERPRALAAMFNVLREGGYLIFGVPIGAKSRKADERFNRAWKLLSGKTNIWLDEHKKYGLPEEEEIKQILSNLGISRLNKNGRGLGAFNEIEGAAYYQQDNVCVNLWPMLLLLSGISAKIFPYTSKNIFILLLPLLARLNFPGYRQIYFVRKNQVKTHRHKACPPLAFSKSQASSTQSSSPVEKIVGATVVMRGAASPVDAFENKVFSSPVNGEKTEGCGRKPEKQIVVFVIDTFDSPKYNHGEQVVEIIVMSNSQRCEIRHMPFNGYKDSEEKYLNQLSKILEFAQEHPNFRIIINLSLGRQYDYDEERSLIKKLYDRGVIMVAATGNNDSENPLFYPAAYEEVIAVAALDENGLKLGCSNYGKYIDLAASGRCRTTIIQGGIIIIGDAASFAPPRVTGLIADLWSRRPDLSGEEIVRIIKETALPIQGSSWIYYAGLLGAGAINPEGALKLADTQYSKAIGFKKDMLGSNKGSSSISIAQKETVSEELNGSLPVDNSRLSYIGVSSPAASPVNLLRQFLTLAGIFKLSAYLLKRIQQQYNDPVIKNLRACPGLTGHYYYRRSFLDYFLSERLFVHSLIKRAVKSIPADVKRICVIGPGPTLGEVKYLLEITAPDVRIYVIEFWNKNIRNLRKELNKVTKEERSRVFLVRADARNIPFMGSVFDFIYSSQTFCTAILGDELGAAGKEVIKALSRGGIAKLVRVEVTDTGFSNPVFLYEVKVLNSLASPVLETVWRLGYKAERETFKLQPSSSKPGWSSSPVGENENRNVSIFSWVGRTVAILLVPFALFAIGLMALLSKLLSLGPLFFVQQRVGFRGRSIRIWKMRTFTDEQNQDERKITRFGHLIRGTGLDETPQIFSIIRGELQWFGPRPTEKKDIDQAYIDEVLFRIKPGIFSLSVLTEGIGAEVRMPLDYRKAADLAMIHRQSFLNNVLLLYQTLKIVLSAMMGVRRTVRFSKASFCNGKALDQKEDSDISSSPAVYSLHVELFMSFMAWLDESLKSKEIGISSKDLIKGRILNIGLESAETLSGNLNHSVLCSHNLVAHLRAKGIDIIGLDPLVQDDPENGYMQGVVQDMRNLSDSEFDTVLIIALFDLLYFPFIQKGNLRTQEEFYDAAAREIKRVLKHKGFCFIFGADHNEECIYAFWRAGFKIVNFHPEVADFSSSEYLLINHKLITIAASLVAPQASSPAEVEKRNIVKCGDVDNLLVSRLNFWLRFRLGFKQQAKKCPNLETTYDIVRERGYLFTDDEHGMLFDFLWENKLGNYGIYPSLGLKGKIIRNRSAIPYIWLLRSGFVTAGIIKPILSLGLTHFEQKEVWKIVGVHKPQLVQRTSDQIDEYGLKIYPRINEFLRSKKSIRVLDLGCGKSGRGIFSLKKRYGRKIDGYGINLEIEARPKNVMLVEGNIKMMPFSNASFDIIYASNVMYYFSKDELPDILKEVFRVLAVNGKFIFDIAMDHKFTLYQRIIENINNRMKVEYKSGELVITKGVVSLPIAQTLDCNQQHSTLLVPQSSSPVRMSVKNPWPGAWSQEPGAEASKLPASSFKPEGFKLKWSSSPVEKIVGTISSSPVKFKRNKQISNSYISAHLMGEKSGDSSVKEIKNTKRWKPGARWQRNPNLKVKISRGNGRYFSESVYRVISEKGYPYDPELDGIFVSRIMRKLTNTRAPAHPLKNRRKLTLYGRSSPRVSSSSSPVEQRGQFYRNLLPRNEPGINTIGSLNGIGIAKFKIVK